MLKALQNKIIKLMIIPRIRMYYCKMRWLMLKRNIKYYDQLGPEVTENVIKHNISAFKTDAAFGCGNRMSLLFYPLAALLATADNPKILIVGPRTEDDIFFSKSLGFADSIGLDLFSYSPYIELGDFHKLPYLDQQFDAVILGWVLAYSGDPLLAISESKRVLKSGGYLAIGWEWVPADQKLDNLHIRGNSLNEVNEFRELVNLSLVFVNNPAYEKNHHKSLVFLKE